MLTVHVSARILEGSAVGGKKARMTEPIRPRTYRTSSGRVLTDADIELIAEVVATTDYDLTRAKVLYPPDAPETARKAAMRSPRDPKRTSPTPTKRANSTKCGRSRSASGPWSMPGSA